jgi:hypothetical protein
MVVTDERKSRITILCRELVGLLGLTQGSVEIHCHAGKPKQVHLHDKSLKLDDEMEKPHLRR